MAQILAINPGGTQSATLARLARELRGHELIGADSCTIAMTAIGRRMPDLILLPPTPERGQQELLARLRQVPGGVPTITLPPVTTADPKALAEQVREILEGPKGASVQLIAAANAAIGWIRKRRASWEAAGGFAREPALEGSRRFPLEAGAPGHPRTAGVARTTPSWRVEKPGAPEPFPQWVPPPEPFEREEPSRPSFPLKISDATSGMGDFIRAWIPRLVTAGIVIALGAAGLNYWPRLRSALTMGAVVLETTPPGSQVFIDGALVGTTPMTAQLPAGPHTVEFRDSNRSRTMEVVVVARDQLVQRVDWTAKPTGSLSVSSDPTGAMILVDGKFRGTTPMTVDGLSVGTHAVVVEMPNGGSIRRTVKIAADQTTNLSEVLVAGWLAVFSPFEITISEGNRLISTDDRGRAMLSPGSHRLRFRNAALGYDEVRTVQIRPTETTTLNLVPQTTLTITSTEPAEVTIDGARVGGTPITKRRINIGTHTIVLRNGAGQQRQFTVTATSDPVQLDVDFSRPQ
jgi:hypothetical protein